MMILWQLAICVIVVLSLNKNMEAVVGVKVGVVLDKESKAGKMLLSSINMSLTDLYAAHPEFNPRISLHVRDTKAHVVGAAAAVLDLVKNEQVVAILGPETSTQALFAINLGKISQVPIISYSATSPFLSPLQNQYFVRATVDDSSQVKPLSAIIKAFGWREVVPVYVDNEFGGGIIPSLVDALQQDNIRILYRSVIPSSATDDRIEAELYKLKSMQTRVFVVHMTTTLGSRLFLKAKEVGMMSQDYVWIITNAMADFLSSIDPQVYQSMQGVLGVKTFIPRTRERDDFTNRWKMKFQQENLSLLDVLMNVDGLRAYDATTALARAVERAGISSFTFQRSDNNSANSSTDLSSLGVSVAGPQLLQAILSAKFQGLSGSFSLVHGQLQSSTFQFVNVIDNVEKVIGYWTPSSGLVKELALANTTSKYSTSKESLRTIIWPGDPTFVPKGWVISPNGKKLQIGVPVKDGFKDFVDVTRNPETNMTLVKGYCIDVFEAVMGKLPYLVSYEYVPFAKPDGEAAGDYNQLVNQVYQKKYDAVVGDVTIRADRSLLVDFTLPYTESGVIMIAPIKDDTRRRAWLFVRPLTWELWATTFCFFIFIAFVIWVLEHRINEDFRGPPWHHVGTSLYYSFATIVFSHSFGVLSNLTRFVVIVWIFVVLILTQSYTANLASLLTVEQLQPTVTDVKDLINSGQTVGYQNGSFVRELLMGMNFSESQLKPYDSVDVLDELLTKGAANGGIAAAFDEIPFVKIFLAKHCSKYTKVQPTYKADGFGFAFPIGSPLVSDVSRAVLKVQEGEEMTDIENKWFKKQNVSQDSSTSTSRSLTLDSFWGLFTIAGVAAMLALIISLTSFLSEYRHVWSDSSASVWTRIRTLFRIYDKRNLSSHTFRKSQPGDSSYPATSPNSPCPRSPSSFWHNSESGLNNFEEQSIPSPQNMDSINEDFADRQDQIQDTQASEMKVILQPS